MSIKLHSHSPADTFRIGETMGRHLAGNEIIFLKGELGAGKTLLTKGIAGALGINPEEVVSPTFTLVNEYRGERKPHRPKTVNQRHNNQTHQTRIFHIDLYRLGPSTGQILPEIDDYIDEGVIVVEWAQFLHPSYFKLDRSIDITFIPDAGNENHRTLEIETNLEIFRGNRFLSNLAGFAGKENQGIMD